MDFKVNLASTAVHRCWLINTLLPTDVWSGKQAVKSLWLSGKVGLNVFYLNSKTLRVIWPLPLGTAGWLIVTLPIDIRSVSRGLALS